MERTSYTILRNVGLILKSWGNCQSATEIFYFHLWYRKFILVAVWRKDYMCRQYKKGGWLWSPQTIVRGLNLPCELILLSCQTRIGFYIGGEKKRRRRRKEKKCNRKRRICIWLTKPKIFNILFLIEKVYIISDQVEGIKIHYVISTLLYVWQICIIKWGKETKKWLRKSGNLSSG